MAILSCYYSMVLLLLLGAALLAHHQCSAAAFEKQQQKLSNKDDAASAGVSAQLEEMFSSSLISQLPVANNNNNNDRHLEIGDFAEFNQLFKNAEILLVDEVTLEAPNDMASLNIKNLVCTNFNLGDLQTEYEVIKQDDGSEVLAYTIVAQPFDMRCTAEYSYSLLNFLSRFGLPSIADDGIFNGVTKGNMVKTRIDLISTPGFDQEPPSRAEVKSCDAEIYIEGRIDFDEGAMDEILELFSDPIANLLQSEASKAACNELESMGPDMFNGLLDSSKKIIDEWLQPIPAEMADPLVVERDFVVPDGMKLVNFQKPSGDDDDSDSFVDMLVDILKDANQFLGGGSSSQDRRRTAEDLGINNFVRDAFLDDAGAFSVDMDELDGFDSTLLDVHDKMTESVLKIEGVKMFGLDSLTTFKPFIDIGEHTMSNEFKWERLALELDLSLRIKPSTLPDSMIINPDPIVIEEDIQIKIEFSDLDIVLAIFMAIDQDKLESITLGTLLDDNLLSCLSSTMNAMEVSGLNVTIGDISDPKLDGFISPGFDRVISNFAEAAFRAYEPTLLRAIPYIFQVPVRKMLNDLVEDLFDYGDKANCPVNQEDSAEFGFVDFRDLLLPAQEAARLGGSGDAPYGTLVSTGYDWIKRELFAADPKTGLALINSKIISSLTQSQSGTTGLISFPGKLLDEKADLNQAGIDGIIKLKAYDPYINNVDTIGVPLKLLNPMDGEPYLLNNDARIGSDIRPLQLGIRFLLGLSGQGSKIRNDVNINLNIEALEMLLNLFAKVSEKAFLNYPLRDFANINCWLATIPAPQLDAFGVRIDPDEVSLKAEDFSASVASLGLNISCIECTGPKMSEFASLQGSEDLTELANSVFDFAVDLVEGEFLQNTADRALHAARKQCPHHPDYDPNFKGIEYEPFVMSSQSEEGSVSFAVALIIVLIVMFVAFLFVVLTTKLIVRRRQRKWIASIPQSQVNILWLQQHREQEEESMMNASTASMVRSPCIPLWLRLAMPLIILGNIALFLSGHLSLGGSIVLIANIAGESFTASDFYEFSMYRSTIEMWNAGAKELAILIFILSFAWPYTKQLLTLGLWFAPPRAVSVKRRGSILLWLDALAKWSMADIFVLVVTIVVFRVSIQSPDVGFLPEDFYSIDLLLIPMWGLYSNMIAQLISQISSHFIIHYHRRIIHVATSAGNEDDVQQLEKQNTAVTEDEETVTCRSQANDVLTPGVPSCAAPQNTSEHRKTRLFDYAFRRPHRGESDKLVARRAVGPLLLFFSTCLCVLIIVGCVVPSYSLNILGIVGLLVESGQGFVEAHNEFSVFTTIRALFDQARFTGETKDYVGLGSLSVILILTVLIVPLLQTVVLLIQWFVPVTRQRRHRLSVALEVLQAWQYVEVYLLSVLVGSWQLGPISEFFFNPTCEPLNGFFSDMVYYGVFKEEDARCFKTDMKVEPTFYILLVAAVVLGLMNSFVAKAASQYFREIEASENLQKIADLEDGRANEADRDAIHPTPVLFTDQYRWFLHREDVIFADRLSNAGFSGASTSESDGDIGALATDSERNDAGSSHDDVTSLNEEDPRDIQEDDESTDSDIVSTNNNSNPEDSFINAPAASDDVIAQVRKSGRATSPDRYVQAEI